MPAKKYFTVEARLAAHAAQERVRRAEGKVVKQKGLCPQCAGPMDRHRRMHNVCRACYMKQVKATYKIHFCRRLEGEPMA